MPEPAANPIEALMEAHERLKLPPIAKMPGRRWAGTFGPWRFVVNASREPIEDVGGARVGPFETYIEYNGWPAGVLTPDGGGQFAAGTGANPETFAAALATWDGRSHA